MTKVKFKPKGKCQNPITQELWKISTPNFVCDFIGQFSKHFMDHIKYAGTFLVTSYINLEGTYPRTLYDPRNLPLFSQLDLENLCNRRSPITYSFYVSIFHKAITEFAKKNRFMAKLIGSSWFRGITASNKIARAL